MRWVRLIAVMLMLGGMAITAENLQWPARWIWLKRDAAEPFQFVRFRKQFQLEAIPKQAKAFIAADTFYRFWVNSRFVMQGPARSSAGKATADVLDITPFLRPGNNTIVGEVLHYNFHFNVFETLPQAPGFLCQLEMETEKGPHTIGSDATWEASQVSGYDRQAPRFTGQRGWVEDYDARQGNRWQPPVVLGKVGMAPWRTVELRDIPLPTLREIRPAAVVAVHRSDGFFGEVSLFGRERKAYPPDWVRRLETERLHPDNRAAVNPEGMTEQGQGGAVLSNDGASVTYDFGANFVGFAGLEVSGKAGQVLELAWHERLSPRDGVVRPREALSSNQMLRYTLREGRQSFLAFNPQLIRYLRVVLRGESEATLHRLWLTEFRFAALPKGSFVCSDSSLNRIFEAARRTAMLNTLDTFMDNPSRERSGWFHDSYWTAQAVFACFGDFSINHRMARQGAESQGYLDPPGMVQMCYPAHHERDRFIPGHALFWVLQAGLDERFTGDGAFVRTLLPAVQRLLETFNEWCGAEGLLEDVPSWNFLDWANLKTDGVSVGLNALYAKALEEAARLERSAGRAEQALTYEKRGQRLREALNRFCTTEVFYPDTLVRNERGQLMPHPHTSESTQYFVLWARVPPEVRATRMWHALRDAFMPAALARDETVQGLFRGGLYSFFQRLQTAAYFNDYGRLVRDSKAMFSPMTESEPGTLWETPWGESSRCQGIASGVAAILMEEVLGIRLGFPVRIAPHGGGTVRWCQGHMITPRGPVGVAWVWRNDRYELQVSLPDGVIAEVLLPDEAKEVWRSASVQTEWRQRWQVRRSSTIVVEPGKLTVR